MYITIKNSWGQRYINAFTYDYNDVGIWSAYALSFLFVVSIIYILLNYKTALALGVIFKISLVYVAFACLMSMPSMSYGMKILSKSVIIPTLAPISLVVFYIYARNVPDSRGVMQILAFIAFIVFIIGFKRSYSESQSMNLHMTFGDGYYALFLLPFLLTVRSNIMRYLLLFAIGACALLSGKRGMILAFVLGSYAFLLIQNVVLEKKFKVLYVVFTPIMGVIILAAMLYYDASNHGFVLQRFMEIEETNGNGRIDIWIMGIQTFLSSSPFRMLVGHGVYTYENPILPIVGFAHNDYISTLVYFGIIGFILMTLFSIYLMLTTWKAIKIKAEFSSILAYSVVVYSIMMLISIVFYCPAITLFLFASMGYLIGLIDNQKQMLGIK